MKKIRTVLALLIVLGFISTLVGGVGYVYGNPDGVTDNFDTSNPNSNPEYYIDSKTNLVVSGGQVMLEQEPVVCDSGGVAQTTGWGANLYNCSGSNKRCHNGTCVTCGGWLYDDGCSGCAGQGVAGVHNNACWYGSGAGQTCTTVCGGQGCVAAEWNDDSSCTVLKTLIGCGWTCRSGAYNFAPTTKGGTADGWRRSGASQSCGGSYSGWKRACVCNY